MKQKRIVSLLTAAGVLIANVPLLPAVMPENALTASAENDDEFWEAYKNGGYGFTREFDEESGTLTISGEGEMFDGYQMAATPFMDMAGLKKLVIADGVTNISDFAFSACRELTAVTLPGSITSIGTAGFTMCSALTEIVLPDGVTSIGGNAFYGCTALTEITIPDSVTEIDETAFSECENLTIKGSAGSYAETFAKENDFVFESIGNAEPNATGGSCGENVIWTLDPDYYELTISGTGDMQDYTGGTDSASASPFQALDFYTAEIQNGVTGIGDYAFADCKKLNWITISDSVTRVGEGAFSRCVKLEQINLPKSVTQISDSAFTGCTRLEWVKIPAGVTAIGSGAFDGCTNLEEITIPESVTDIGSGNTVAVFDGCEKLTIKGVKGSAAEEYANTFNIPFAELEAPPTSGSCGENVTWNLENGTLTISGTGDMKDYFAAVVNPPYIALTFDTVVIEDGVTSIGNAAFISYDHQLQNVTIPDSVTRIGANAFSGCAELKDITIPNSVTSIGLGAFSDCTGLTEVTIPDSVTAIGSCAFDDCTNLETIVIPESVTDIGFTESEGQTGTPVFSGCEKLTIKGVKGSAAEEYANAFSIPFEEIEAQQPTSGKCGDNLTWALEDGTVTISGTGDMTNYSGGADGVKSPFWDLDFDTLVIEDGVTGIGSAAFSHSKKLSSVSISESVTKIGGSAFEQCEALTSVAIPDGVTEIDDYAFGWCYSLASVTIPESVTGIGRGAFTQTKWLYDLSVENPFVIVNNILIYGGMVDSEEVIIPDGTARISGGAFQGNDNIVSVTIPDGVTKIGDYAFADCAKLTTVTIPDSVWQIGTKIVGEYEMAGLGDHVTIVGYEESYAEAYAKNNSIPFEALKRPEPEVYNCLKYLIENDKVIIVGHTDDLPAVLEIPAEIDGMPVTGFAQSALAQCDKLKEVTLPDTITSSGMQTFWGCKNLEKVTLPSTLKGLYEASFAECTALKSVTIPEGCETIGNLVFAGCTSLSEVSIPESVVNFFEPAFGGTPWLAAKQAENPLVAVNGILIDASGASGEVTVPDGVKVINSYAFMDCNAITKITLPESAAKIDGISSAALTDVTILNPECEIKDAEGTITNGYDSDADKMNYKGTIHGYDGSTAQAYAEKYGYTFESLGAAPEGPVSDWAEKTVISKNTGEAELVVRVGDIDACNDNEAVSEHGYDPFTAKSQYAHGYPWLKDETDPAGTDRIFVGSKWTGEAADGYSSNYVAYKNGDDEENAYGDGALTFTMEYDASDINIENVLLQLCIDDFQAGTWNSEFTVTLNGKDAPFIAELLNHTDQTGPTAYIVSAMIPSGFFADIASGKLTVVIDETTGVGDGYAIDFARLLINYDEQIFTGTFSGKTEPGATVRLLGTSTTVTAMSDGTFTFNAIPGINAVRASKDGFVEKYDSGIVLSTGTEWSPEVMLDEGQGSPDIDFSKFAGTGQLLKGDVNGNGEIGADDAQMTLKAYVNMLADKESGLNDAQKQAADIDGDNAVTATDAQIILKYYVNTLAGKDVKWEDLLPKKS